MTNARCPQCGGLPVTSGPLGDLICGNSHCWHSGDTPVWDALAGSRVAEQMPKDSRKIPQGGSGTAPPKRDPVSMQEIVGRRIVSAEIQPNPLHPNTQMSLWLLFDDGTGLEATTIFGPDVEHGTLTALSLRHHKPVKPQPVPPKGATSHRIDPALARPDHLWLALQDIQAAIIDRDKAEAITQALRDCVATQAALLNTPPAVPTRPIEPGETDPEWEAHRKVLEEIRDSECHTYLSPTERQALRQVASELAAQDCGHEVHEDDGHTD